MRWVGVNATAQAWHEDVQSSAQRLLLLAIARYADENGRAYPSVATLSADTRLNPKTIYKSLSELKSLGLLYIEKRSNGGNAYTLTSTTENGTPENGTPKNGTTENGTTGNGSRGIPKTEVRVFQKRNATTTKNGTRTKQEQSNEESNEESSNAHRAAPARRKRASACPFESGASIPDDYREAAEKVRVADPQRVFNSFVDHAIANGRTLVDWMAGWRMWCRKEIEYHPQAAKQETAAERGHRLGLF